MILVLRLVDAIETITAYPDHGIWTENADNPFAYAEIAPLDSSIDGLEFFASHQEVEDLFLSVKDLNLTFHLDPWILVRLYKVVGNINSHNRRNS